MQKLATSLKACQLCHSMDHTTSFCSTMNKVQAVESYVEEEAKFTKDVQKNPNTSYQPKDASYSNWDNYTRGERGPTPNVQPYRPLGFPEPAKAATTNNDDLSV